MVRDMFGKLLSQFILILLKMVKNKELIGLVLYLPELFTIASLSKKADLEFRGELTPFF